MVHLSCKQHLCQGSLVMHSYFRMTIQRGLCWLVQSVQRQHWYCFKSTQYSWLLVDVSVAHPTQTTNYTAFTKHIREYTTQACSWDPGIQIWWASLQWYCFLLDWHVEANTLHKPAVVYSTQASADKAYSYSSFHKIAGHMHSNAVWEVTTKMISHISNIVEQNHLASFVDDVTAVLEDPLSIQTQNQSMLSCIDADLVERLWNALERLSVISPSSGRLCEAQYEHGTSWCLIWQQISETMPHDTPWIDHASSL